MDIVKTMDDNGMTLAVSGRLETATAPQLENEVKGIPQDVKRLRLDLGRLEYVSSAGLRVILNAHKIMNTRGGTFEVTGANPSVKRVFDITGFTPILNFV